MPDLLESFVEKCPGLLEDRSHSVLLAGVTLMLDICGQEPRAAEVFRPQVPQLCRVLRSLIMGGFTPGECSGQPSRAAQGQGGKCAAATLRAGACMGMVHPASTHTPFLLLLQTTMWAASTTRSCRWPSCACCACWGAAPQRPRTP